MLRDEHRDEALGPLAAQLIEEIESDRQVADALARRLDDGSSLLKDATGWLGAKIGRLKLGRAAGTLGTFQALEALALGILGKLALWDALAAVSDARLAGVDFQALAERARGQHRRVEHERLRLAQTALQRV
jgi:hypothetical protein